MSATLKASEDEINAEVKKKLNESTLESLFVAVSMNKPLIVRRMLCLGEEFGYEMYEGISPLSSSRERRGVDPNGRNEAGATPLHIAAIKGHADVGRWLCTAGADPNALFQGNTPLHLAVSEGCSEFCAMILQNGARVNEKDAHGFTPLHLAAVRNNRLLANLLIASGADPTILDGDGKTVAQRWNFNAVNPACRPFLAPNEGYGDVNAAEREGSSSGRIGVGGGGQPARNAMSSSGHMDSEVVDKVLLARFKTFPSFKEERKVEVLPEGIAAARYIRTVQTSDIKKFFLSLDAMGAPPDVHERQVVDMLCDALKIRTSRTPLPDVINFNEFCVIWLKAHSKGLIP